MNPQCSLLDKKCKPCEGGMPALTPAEIVPLFKEISGWINIDDKRIEKEYSFKNFKQAVLFINKIADIAEAEGHHPDVCLHNYRKVRVTLSTFAVHGLSENDFILAAKIDTIHV